MKKCTKCGVEKPLTEFATRPQNKDGRRNCCRECNTPADTTHKMCSKCKTEKPLTDFHKDAGASGGFCYWCNPCQAEANRNRLLQDPVRQRAIVTKAWMKRAYGITPEEKEALVISQGGRCAVCLELFSSSFNTHVDHIHGSDPAIVRGILCPQCNTGLGNFKDSPERLLNAAAYLKKISKNPLTSRLLLRTT